MNPAIERVRQIGQTMERVVRGAGEYSCGSFASEIEAAAHAEIIGHDGHQVRQGVAPDDWRVVCVTGQCRPASPDHDAGRPSSGP